MMAREASAQVIHVSATVTRPYPAFGLQSDTLRVAPAEGVHRVRIDGVGLLDVLGGPGGVIRTTTRPAESETGEHPARTPGRIVRVTIDYVGS